MDKIPGLEKHPHGQYILKVGREEYILFDTIEDIDLKALKALAKHLGMKGYSKFKKNELIREIQKKLGIKVMGLTEKESKYFNEINVPDSPDFEEKPMTEQEIKEILNRDTELPVRRSFFDNPIFDANVFRTVRQYADRDTNYDWFIENQEYTKALKWILSKNLLSHLENFMLNYGEYVDWNEGVKYVILYNDISKFYPRFIIEKITDWNDFVCGAIIKKNWKLIECINLVKNSIKLDDKLLSKAIGESGSMTMFNYIKDYYIQKIDWNEVLEGAAISGRKSIARKAISSGKNIKKTKSYEIAMKYGNKEIANLISPDRKLNINSVYYGYGYSGKVPADDDNKQFLVFQGAVEANNEKIIRELSKYFITKGIDKHTKNDIVRAAIKGDNKIIIDRVLKVGNNDYDKYLRISISFKNLSFVKYFSQFCDISPTIESEMSNDLWSDNTTEKDMENSIKIFKYLAEYYNISKAGQKALLNRSYILEPYTRVELIIKLGL